MVISGCFRALCARNSSTLWKIFFRFFHAMEDFLVIFPRYGRFFWEFSTLWKISFHGVESVFHGVAERVA